MILYQCIEFLATLLECIIGILFTAKVEGQEKIKWRGNLIVALILASVAWVIAQYQLFSIVTSLVGIVGIAIGSSFIYELRLKDTMIASVAYMLLLYIIDFLSITFFGILIGEEEFARLVTETLSLNRVWLALLAKSALVIAYLLITKINLRGVRSSISKIWLGLIALGAVIFYFAQMTFNKANTQMLVIWVFLIIVIAILLYSCSQYTDYIMSKRQMELTARSYESLIQNYRDNQIYYHDLKNHYTVIKNYLSCDNYEGAKSYVCELDRVEQAGGPSVLTGIESLDILLACKKREAEAQGISVRIVADQLRPKMEEHELVALFGNALDNAIESCQKVEEGERWIRINIQKINEMAFIKISNSYKAQPETKEGGLLSLKSPQKQFGWGIVSMKTIVDKYGGKMDLQYENEQFDVVIMFFD